MCMTDWLGFSSRPKRIEPVHQRGFTLIELIIFIVVVSAGLAGILSVMNTTIKSSADPMVRKQMIAAAESLLEEIVLTNYADPSGGTGCTGSVGVRADWDDVCDYNHYATTSGIVDKVGNPKPGLGSYNISPPVTVQDTSDLTGVTAKKITVFVTHGSDTISLTGYRANY